MNEDVRHWRQNRAYWRHMIVSPWLATVARYVLATCLALAAGWYLIHIGQYAASGFPGHSDFFGIWSWARFEIEQPPERIYDHAAQQAFLLSLDPDYPGPLPFPYPPTYLLMIRPLGLLSYTVAHATWSGVTFLAYAAALWCPRAWWLTALIAIFAPATLANLLSGQNGFLSAALLIGGIRLASPHPVLGGVLLGLLSYKPQFGILIVVALAAARLWRTVFAATITVMAVVAASLIAFGDKPWTAWIRAMPDFWAIWYSEHLLLLNKMPTVLANALALGLSLRLAFVSQAVVSFAVAAAVWIVFRRKPDMSSAAALAVGSILATPYAFYYDLTLVAAAVAVVAAEYGAALSVKEVLVLAVALLLPLGMALDLLPPVSTFVLGALFALILWRRGRSGSTVADENNRVTETI